MNNEMAADLMESGQFKGALIVLDAALARNRQQAANDDHFDSDIETSSSNSSNRREYHSSTQSSTTPRKPLLTTECSDANPSNDEDFVYRRPIRLSDLPNNQEMDNYSMSIILIFNMGLCHHMLAFSQQGETADDKQKKQMQRSRLHKALKLYELSFWMQVKGDTQLTTTQVLALVNNCGQIYKQLDRERKAKKFFQHMLTTLMTMIDLGEIDHVDQFDGFIRTASRLILNDPAVAPAA